jgi:hypothetical protein
MLDMQDEYDITWQLSSSAQLSFYEHYYSLNHNNAPLAQWAGFVNAIGSYETGILEYSQGHGYTGPQGNPFTILIPYSGGRAFVNVWMHAVAGCTQYNVQHCVAESDFSHTMSFVGGRILDSNMTPIVGANLISESGFDYLSPTNGVPEPRTIWMVSACLGGLLLLQGRCRRPISHGQFSERRKVTY